MEVIAGELRDIRGALQASSMRLETLLREANGQTKNLVDEYKSANQMTNRRLVALEDTKDGNMKMVKQICDVHSRSVELGVSLAIQNHVQNPVVIVRSGGYRWRINQLEELDGLVVGSLGGVDVVVFIEAKTSFQSFGAFQNTFDQVKRSISNWERIIGVGDDKTKEDMEDCQELKILENAHWKVVIAIGALNFPILEELEKKLKVERQRHESLNQYTWDILLVEHNPLGFSVVAGN